MNFIRRMMAGRYGGDQLSLCLLVAYLVLSLLGSLLRFAPLSWISYVVFALGAYRMFSRNIAKRRDENMRFCNLVRPFFDWCKLCSVKRKDRDHAYFKCPNCRQTLRVPRGKGRINIHCRSCGAGFETKS
jgi:hypothetical protein